VDGRHKCFPPNFDNTYPPSCAILPAVFRLVPFVYTRTHPISSSRGHYNTMYLDITNLASFALFACYIPGIIAHPLYDVPRSGSPQDPSLTARTNESWSKEAIINLVGVFAAVSCFVIGLAWSRISRWTRNAGSSEYSNLSQFARTTSLIM
jgi:hypothetical protein